jgi:hypothetical protein
VPPGLAGDGIRRDMAQFPCRAPVLPEPLERNRIIRCRVTLNGETPADV